MLGLSDLADIAAEHAADLEAEVRPFDIADQVSFPSAQPAIMGVINLSADSWYRESIRTSVELAVERGIHNRPGVTLGSRSQPREPALQAQHAAVMTQRARLPGIGTLVAVSWGGGEPCAPRKGWRA